MIVTVGAAAETKSFESAEDTGEGRIEVLIHRRANDEREIPALGQQSRLIADFERLAFQHAGERLAGSQAGACSIREFQFHPDAGRPMLR